VTIFTGSNKNTHKENINLDSACWFGAHSGIGLMALEFLYLGRIWTWNSRSTSPQAVFFSYKFCCFSDKKIRKFWKFCIYSLSLTKLVIFWKISPIFCYAKIEMTNHICKLLK
jgi:hypothetical protein